VGKECSWAFIASIFLQRYALSSNSTCGKAIALLTFYVHSDVRLRASISVPPRSRDGVFAVQFYRIVKSIGHVWASDVSHSYPKKIKKHDKKARACQYSTGRSGFATGSR
jgi:hypothetical protein